nr:MAG TPA: hypothetical protein [Caudoviricetes sp.]
MTKTNIRSILIVQNSRQLYGKNFQLGCGIM